ncbi:hypothetical protein CspeluHIS016_0601380 [Cutaneotrichosporon spelunceum]|uniref:choline-phosphate cytidylyltransferase n=1 Tax=Cutaneotrichosporon spelunceum TaxID=1672016 RepID=A0AAD3TY64_9TREE|nr:hypothetical protein CspeluHIS016_0601380 [Cutaneotrichosporon spelunceum]
MAAAPPRRHKPTRAAEGRRIPIDDGSSQDASEEDNDVSDVGSLISVTTPSITLSPATLPRPGPPRVPPSLPLNAMLRRSGDKRQQLSESEGVESPTYDGDIESSSTIGTPVTSSYQHESVRHPASPAPGSTGTSTNHVGRAPTPRAMANHDDERSGRCYCNRAPKDVPVAESAALKNPYKHRVTPGPPRMYELPEELEEQDIRSFVQRAIDGRGEEDGVERWWRTSPPPTDRPVRIYADGVYDLFHFGHAMQLRQAKLSFPRVHLLAGVCSDALCADNKSPPAMTHAERVAGVRQCRWVDEVVPDAPWAPDQAWLDKHRIDYIAHDEIVYPSKDHDDVYAFIKGQGKFLPTRRTPAISTSDLLERIVRGYRDSFFDTKLEKNGQIDLLACDVEWDSDFSSNRRQLRRLRAGLESGDVSQSNSAAPSAPNSEPTTPIKALSSLSVAENA